MTKFRGKFIVLESLVPHPFTEVLQVIDCAGKTTVTVHVPVNLDAELCRVCEIFGEKPDPKKTCPMEFDINKPEDYPRGTYFRTRMVDYITIDAPND